MELNQFPLNYNITQTSDLDITWLLPGISLAGTQDNSSLVLCGMEHCPLVTCTATPVH